MAEKTYIIGREVYPSVTTILNVIAKPQLIAWYKSQLASDIKKTSDKATEIGKLIHEAIAKLLKGEKIEFTTEHTAEVQNCIGAFFEWKQKEKLDILHNELEVVSRKYKYAGTLDCLAFTENRSNLTLLDFKTAKAIYPEYDLQVIAYKKAYEEQYKTDIKSCIIVRFDKSEPKFETKILDLTQKEKLFNIFLCALRIYNWQKGGE
jgi:hypothetical protein